MGLGRHARGLRGGWPRDHQCSAAALPAADGDRHGRNCRRGGTQAPRRALRRRREITKTQRDRVCAELGAEKSYGNFVWLPRADAAEVETKMLDEGVVIRRYLDEGVRVSITDEAETTQFLEAWRRAGIEPWRG